MLEVIPFKVDVTRKSLMGDLLLLTLACMCCIYDVAESVTSPERVAQVNVTGVKENLQEDLTVYEACCKHYGLEPVCLQLCHDGSRPRTFEGFMYCKYKYEHIREACVLGQVPETVRADLPLFLYQKHGIEILDETNVTVTSAAPSWEQTRWQAASVWSSTVACIVTRVFGARPSFEW